MKDKLSERERAQLAEDVADRLERRGVLQASGGAIFGGVAGYLAGGGVGTASATTSDCCDCCDDTTTETPTATPTPTPTPTPTNCYAERPSPATGNWIENEDNPIFDVGDSGDWDERHVVDPEIIRAGDKWHLFYKGVNDDLENKIGHATSPDLINWTRDSQNPILKPGDGWEMGKLSNPCVWKYNGTFHMLYQGSDGRQYRIGHATSSDLVNWTRDSQNPILTTDDCGAWASHSVINPDIHVDEYGRYVLLFGGSSDGKTWKLGRGILNTDGFDSVHMDTTNPILSPSASAWDDFMVSIPSAMCVDQDYYLYYNGKGGADNLNQIGFATGTTSSDWVKHDDNPVIQPGVQSWMEQQCSNPCLFYDGSAYRMLHTGSDGTTGRIGMATLECE